MHIIQSATISFAPTAERGYVRFAEKADIVQRWHDLDLTNALSPEYRRKRTYELLV